MSLLLTALVVPQVWAETLTVANNSATSSNIPVCCNYFDGNTMSQTIYSATMLNDVVGNRITSIKYHASSALASSLAGAVLQISTGETTESTIPGDGTYYDYGVLLTGLNANGTYTIKGGETEIEFVLSEPIIFSGDKNLAIEVKLQASISGYTSVNWNGENQEGKVSVYARGYSNPSNYKDAFMPKTTFTYEAATTDPIIKVGNDVLNFSALVGSSVTNTVTVTGKNLTDDITATIAGDGFSVNPGTLGATGGDLTVTYNPTSAGNHTGTLTLSSAGAEDVVVNLTGTAEAPVTSGTVTPSSLKFNTYPGVAATQTITVENTGNTAFTPSFTIAAPFSIEAATEIAAGASKDFTVIYTPTAVGTDNGTLTVTINGTPTTVTLNGTANEAPKEITAADGTDTSDKLPVYGYYYDDASDNYHQMIYPANMIPSKLKGKKITGLTFYSSSGLNFSGGNLAIRLATTDVEKFESTTKLTMPSNAVSQNFVHNASETLDKITVEFNEPFIYNGGNIIIETQVTTAGTCDTYGNHTYFYGTSTAENYSYCADGYYGSAELEKFLPKVTFAYEETAATPVITVDPATVEAFTTEVGTPVTATVNVTGENLTGDITATVSGDDAFTAALENGVLTITYNPTAAGNHTATVTLSSTSAQDVAIALTGTATAPDYAVTISDNTGAHNYGNVLVNSSNVWTLTITNNGTQTVTPTLSGIEAPFSTTYTATALAAGESATISINYAPTELGEHSNTITISFPEAGDAIAAYTCELSGKAVDESYDPSDENEVVKLVTVDKRSIYEPAFIDNANGNTTPQQLNCYDMRFKMAQPDDPTKQIKAGDLRPGNNLFEFYAIDDFGTEFRFATINLYAEGQPSSNPSVNAMDAPIKVTPSVEYYTEEGMPVHSSYSHNTTLKYTEKTYNDINELVDLEGVIDYVNDTWSANTATNSHPDHYNFQIRGVGQYGDVVTSLTAEYVKDHIGTYGLIEPEGWYRSSWVGPNNEYDDDHVYQDTYYFYDLYISKEWLDSHNITGPVTVVINTTLSGSGFNADNYKTITVNGVEQIIAKEKFKDYSWTVPLVNEPITIYDAVEGTKVIDMGIIISSISGNSDFNKTKSISIYGGGTGVSNVETVGIYKSSMNVKAYTQKQVDEDTDRNLVAMKVGNTETANADVNVLAYADPAVTGYKLNENSSASTTGMSQVATATHNENGSYTVNSVSAYSATYDFVRDESLGNINGMWLPMYPADPSKYFLPVTVANGVGYDDVVRSEGNTYGSAMQQVEKNGSVDFGFKKCYKNSYTWQENGVTYAIYDPMVELTSELPAATGYELYNYRLWVDYDDNAPAWDFDLDGKHIILTDKMDRPLYTGKNTSIGGQGTNGKDEWEFIAPNDLEEVKLVARFYYKKTSTSNSPRIKARPTDSDRLYYVVEKQVTIPLKDIDIVTGIDNVTGKAVAGVKYYNIAGVESDRPFQGVNIEVTRYTDGSKSTRKILK